MKKLIVFDLDGTLTQHRTPIEDENLAVLTALSEKYRLLMMGAGDCFRIFRQLRKFPIDIVGNYGMQTAYYNRQSGTLELSENLVMPCDKESVARRVRTLREKYGFTAFTGESVQFHASGCVTIPILGTAADIADKLSCDPDRTKRRAIYDEVCELFPEYHVFVGGSSSFDMAPRPYDKRYALAGYCREQGIAAEDVLFVGDDYGLGGNDEPVYRSEFAFLTVDDYKTFPAVVRAAGLL